MGTGGRHTFWDSLGSRFPSPFTRDLNQFYNTHQNEPVLKLNFPVEGWTVVCPYKSKRKSGTFEWRRALILARINVNLVEIYLFDHGIFLKADFRSLKRLYRPFGNIPVQTIEAKMAGNLNQGLWTSKEKKMFKKFIKSCPKNLMLAMVGRRKSVPISGKIQLILINCHKADLENLKSSCANFQVSNSQEILDSFDSFEPIVKEKIKNFQQKYLDHLESTFDSDTD